MVSDSLDQNLIRITGVKLREILSRESKPRVWGIALLSAFILLVLTGMKEFTVWRQILDVYPNTKVSAEYLAGLSPRGTYDDFVHLPRILLMWPVMTLAYTMGWDHDRLFGVVVILNLLSASGFLGNALARRCHVSPSRSTLAFLTFFFCLSLAMNGRMSFSFLATCSLLWLYERRESLRLSTLVLAILPVLWAASVSTGVYAVAFAWVTLFMAQYVAGKVRGRKPGLPDYAVAVPAFLLFAWFALAGTLKNIAFYGNDWLAPFRMLHHGAGHYLFTPWAPLGIGLVFAAYRLRRFYLPKGLPPFYYVTAATGLAGGIFGFSTLTTALPPLLMLGMIKLLQESANAPSKL